jgi:hypothetical protein
VEVVALAAHAARRLGCRLRLVLAWLALLRRCLSGLRNVLARLRLPKLLLLLLLRSRMLLDVCLRVRQVADARRVTSPNAAFLKVAFEDVAARERVAAEHTHVWPVAGVAQEMALKMLRMQVSLLAVRTRELAILVLLGNHGRF